MSEADFLMGQYWALTDQYSSMPDGKPKSDLRTEIIALCKQILSIQDNIFLRYEVALLNALDDVDEWYAMRMKEVRQQFGKTKGSQ